jgi:molecular chaperone DnaK
MIIGVDLGTTNSVVSYFTEDGEADTLENDRSNEKTPSVVIIEDGDGSKNVTVGESAERKRRLKPEQVLARTKQDIDKDELVSYEIDGEEYDPIDAAAYVLGYLKDQAEQKLDREVEGAVITVPYDFTNKGRQRTKDAGEIAGLDVKQVINEPTAACLAYVHENDVTGTLLVYDLGGGTFDATLVNVENTVINVIGTEGDGELGGEDFDDALYELAREKIAAAGEVDPEDADPQTRSNLRRDLKELKHNLTDLNDDFISYQGDDGTIQLDFAREEFEEAIGEKVDTTFEKMDALFEKDAVVAEGISKDDVDSVLLVGGSTRVPIVHERVEEYFDKDPKRNVNPDTVVAQGGAIQAAEYRDDVPVSELPPHTITNVLSHNVGVQLHDGTFDELLAESVNVPAENDDTYTNPEDNVTTIEIPVWEKGEQGVVLDEDGDSEEEQIGDLELSDLPKADEGELDIEVTFVANPDGTLRVEAYEAQSDQTVETTIEGLGLDDEEMEEKKGRLDMDESLSTRVGKSDD